MTVKVEVTGIQTIATKNPNRARHIWYRRLTFGDAKCVLCGAVTNDPVGVERGTVDPDFYEKITESERQLMPFRHEIECAGK